VFVQDEDVTGIDNHLFELEMLKSCHRAGESTSNISSYWAHLPSSIHQVEEPLHKDVSLERAW
jgi:hypothetical protein